MGGGERKISSQPPARALVPTGQIPSSGRSLVGGRSRHVGDLRGSCSVPTVAQALSSLRPAATRGCRKRDSLPSSARDAKTVSRFVLSTARAECERASAATPCLPAGRPGESAARQRCGHNSVSPSSPCRSEGPDGPPFWPPRYRRASPQPPRPGGRPSTGASHFDLGRSSTADPLTAACWQGAGGAEGAATPAGRPRDDDARPSLRQRKMPSAVEPSTVYTRPNSQGPPCPPRSSSSSSTTVALPGDRRPARNTTVD